MEVAAGLLVAEQVISTTIEAGLVAGYAVAKDTNKLKATFTRIGTVPLNSPDSLARANHSVNVYQGDLYIFGGKVSRAQLAGNEMHILKLSNLNGLGPQYRAIPALAGDGADVPQIRAGHTASVINDKIVMFGGYGKLNTMEPLDEGGRVWIFDPASLQWSHLDVANANYPKLHSHAAVVHNNTLIVHGGYSSASSMPCSESWCFDLASRVWIKLPTINDLLEPSSSALPAPPNLTIVGDKIYVVTGNTSLEGQIHVLDVSTTTKSSSWTAMDFPTNPLTPGPQPRQGAAIVPISTAIGRTYLLLGLGAKTPTSHVHNAASENQTPDTAAENAEVDSGTESQEDFWSELWSFQLPAADYTPSQLRDATRSKMGISSGTAQWAEIEIILPKELPSDEGSAGKLHPGPRGYFGSAAIDKGKVVIWGGLNPKGDIEGDGWIIDVHT